MRIQEGGDYLLGYIEKVLQILFDTVSMAWIAVQWKKRDK